MPNDDKDKPEVIAWRMGIVEDRLKSIDEKLDGLLQVVVKSQCPSPGSCVGLAGEVEKITTRINTTDAEVTRIREEIIAARASVKALLFSGSLAGSVMGAAAGLLVQYLGGH